MFASIIEKFRSAIRINKKNRYESECVKICLIYMVIGSLWIYYSDRIASKIAVDSGMLLIINTYKGWLYVIVTSIVLYILINNLLKKVDLTEKKLNESYDKLSDANTELEAYVQQLAASEEELRTQYDQIIESEKKLSKSEEKYRVLVNQMQQGLALYEVNPDDEEKINNYRLIEANESYEKLIGIKKKEVSGKTISEIFPALENKYIEILGHVSKTGEATCYDHYYSGIDKYYEVIAYRPKDLQVAVIVNDITQRKNAEMALQASEYNFRSIFEGSSDGILIVRDNKIIDCNIAMVDLLGYDSKTYILGKNPTEFSPEKQPDGETSEEKTDKVYKCAFKNGKCKFEWWYRRADGESLPVEVMMTTILINGKKVFHSVWRDISERKKMENKLEYLSYHDQLTGLYNRRYFEEEMNRLDADNRLPLTIVMADVNGLKLVNDSFGHAVGDMLLKKVAEVIAKGCREKDIAARLSGDEFVILLPETKSNEAEKIVKNIKTLALNEKVSSVDISISFGYETKLGREEKIQDILKKAEDHMYKQKLFDSPSMRSKTINAIITTLHEKNKREEQHSYRVSKLCEDMGKALGLSEEEIQELKTVGLLHDIGKIAIEENIINKPGKLTDEEWEEIKRHPEIGYRILSTVNDMLDMAEHVLAHHERWDGAGYPKGISGKEIPLQSRIITIADSYDAMVSERSYRNALPDEVALEELKKNSGSQFDPELVNVFIEKVLNKSFI